MLIKCLFVFQYGRQNIENVRKQTHPLINRLDSEDERNVSGVTDPGDDNNQIDTDTVDGNQQSQTDAEFKKPLPPTSSDYKPVKRKVHKKHNSNGNTVISRDDALILVPDGVQNTDGFTFIRTPRGSDNENSDTEVSLINLSCAYAFCNYQFPICFYFFRCF